MAERTTIAETLSVVFEKLEEKCSPVAGQSQISLLTAWSAVLGGGGRSQLDVVQAIGQVCAALLKLEAQVLASKRLSQTARASALEVVGNFRALFAVQRFSEPASSFLQYCTLSLRGNLGMVGYSLELEFSEPKLEVTDTEKLIEALKGVQAQLSTSNIKLDLRLSLSRHITLMLWWLEHPEMASLQDLFEMVGSAMVVATQMKDQPESGGSEEREAGKSIYSRINEIGNKLASMVGIVSKAAGAVDSIANSSEHILKITGI